MDIDFIIQDTFALTRPQWKLAANLDQAGRAFADLVKQNYKGQEPEKTLDAEEPDEGTSSDDEDDEVPAPELDAQSSSDEAEAEVCYHQWSCWLSYADWRYSLRQMASGSRILILRRTSLSHAMRKNVILKLKLNLTESLPK